MCVLSQSNVLCFCNLYVGICSRDFLQLLLEKRGAVCNFVLSVVLCNPGDSICFTFTS